MAATRTLSVGDGAALLLGALRDAETALALGGGWGEATPPAKSAPEAAAR